MVNEKGKYIGEPKVIIHRRHGTPEEVARNRENFRKALCNVFGGKWISYRSYARLDGV